MCAINGFNWRDEVLCRRMNAVTAHRGPDGTAIYASDGVTLGHNRLAIIDLDSRSSQPMKSSDGNLVITYNGELYNYLNLKKELGNYQYRTESDTEVILVAYQKWGRDCVKKFDGIFAFAIWDMNRKEIFLARDQMGVKPLYYYYQNGKFIFSSEIKAILKHDITRRLNLGAFNHYMRLLYAPAPDTMFEGIKKLLPGHYLVFTKDKYPDPRLSDGQASVYWEASSEKTKLNYAEAKVELRERVLASVRQQLVSDRPLGVYLSGGIDSSIITASVKKVRNSIDTFSVGFALSEGEQESKFNADFDLARETAKYFGTTHHEIMLEASNVWDLLIESIWHLDEPVSNATAVPMLALSRFAGGDVRVVLSGDGGDELFGGYPRYQRSRILDYLHLPVSVNKRFERFMFQKDDVLSKIISSRYWNSGLMSNKLQQGPSGVNKTEQLMRLDRQSWLVDEALLRADKLAMANAVEARVPLLSTELINLANSLPISWKVSPFNTKIILKEAFVNDLPTNVLGAPKRGFFSPGAKWLRRPDILTHVRDVLKSDYHAGSTDLFDWSAVNNMLERHVAGEYHYNPLWAIITFQIWAKRFDIKI